MSVRTHTLRDITALIVQKRWLLLIPIAVGLATVPVLARFAPERYRSEALLLVIPQQVPKDYVTPTMTQSIEERLPAITDQILSRSRLEQVIQQLDLYPAERERQVMEDVIQRMRLDIQTSAARPTNARRDVNSFRIAYVSDNAEKARKVTERLASLYIEQNLKDRENQADSTSQFLTTQLDEAKRRLVDQEKKLEEYKRSHAGQLPTQLQGNLQAIQTASFQVQSVNESINRPSPSRRDHSLPGRRSGSPRAFASARRCRAARARPLRMLPCSASRAARRGKAARGRPAASRNRTLRMPRRYRSARKPRSVARSRRRNSRARARSRRRHSRPSRTGGSASTSTCTRRNH